LLSLRSLTPSKGLLPCSRKQVRVVLIHMGIPLDEVEDLLLESAAYPQAGHVLLPKLYEIEGRPLTPLHSQVRKDEDKGKIVLPCKPNYQPRDKSFFRDRFAGGLIFVQVIHWKQIETRMIEQDR